MTASRDAVFIHGGHRNGGLAVFEGAGRTVAFILEVNMVMPEVGREALRKPERSPAGRVEIQGGGIIQRQDILIAPQVGRAARQAAQDVHA
ncbi:MAG: hypothetical protein MZV64_60270 [Ignavibacteriales bacterium]|nr:hypothetical protein [Ignavibacteriales bacterium]